MPIALADHFRYTDDGVYETHSTASKSILINEIQWLRPLLYRGCGNGCHAWVLFGYNQAPVAGTEFKIVLGWGGAAAWYTLDNMPGFPNNQYHATRLAPASVVAFVGGSAGGDGSPAQPFQNLEAALAGAPDGARVIFKAGSTNDIGAGTLTLDRPMTLYGQDIVIR